MIFECTQVLSKMIKLYQIKNRQNRFKQYLELLQNSNTGDLKLPIDGYNPMGKQHVIDQLTRLQEIEAEQIIQRELKKINYKTDKSIDIKFQVILTVADHLGGAWTNRFATDYKNKFKSHAIRKRGFCTPVIWVDEEINTELVIARTNDCIYRTVYQVEHGDPISLKDHIAQEVYVYTQRKALDVTLEDVTLELLDRYYQQNELTDDHSIIFNFLYGDQGSKSLGYAEYGINKSNGFDYCQYIAAIDIK